jgi:hypothetical protein
MAILSTDDFDATEIDPMTVRLLGPVGTLVPDWYRFGDVAAPVGGDPEPCECTEEGPDGLTDLKLKFWRQDVLGIIGEVEDGNQETLTINGELMDGTPFAAVDCIEIIKRGKFFTAGAPEGSASAVSDPREDNETTWSTIKALYR